jgi:photoactive yellow protein
MAHINSTQSSIQFSAPNLQAQLDALRDDPDQYDALDFGLVAMDLDGTVVAYNRIESEFARVSKERALGLLFFSDVAPCTNNYLVSGRFEDESMLDETLDYTFTVKMRPTPVKLRLLKDDRAKRQYLAVKW